MRVARARGARDGFTALKQPGAFMERHNPNVYAGTR